MTYTDKLSLKRITNWGRLILSAFHVMHADAFSLRSLMVACCSMVLFRGASAASEPSIE